MKKYLLMMLMLVAICSTAWAQTVTTDKRFVRGATMAFGRMTVSGIASTQIEEQGFCYSTEKAEPTVDDLTTKAYLNNSGRIYWLKELTPATKYYMRAYVKTKSGEAIYGDVIGDCWWCPSSSMPTSRRRFVGSGGRMPKAPCASSCRGWTHWCSHWSPFTSSTSSSSRTTSFPLTCNRF